MNTEERKAILERMPKRDMMRMLRRCSHRSILCPTGAAVLALPVALCFAFVFAVRGRDVPTPYAVTAVVIVTLITATACVWLGFTRGRKLLDEELDNIQQGCSTVSSEGAPSEEP